MRSEQGGGRDVIVIGAGAAGLACAADLVAAGLRVSLLEASDAVGGRIRTDRVSGFVTDRGFQVFNTAYPQVKRRLALRPLRLRPFTPGVLVHTGGGGSCSSRIPPAGRARAATWCPVDWPRPATSPRSDS